MKAALFLFAASALATSAPRIELDLSAVSQAQHQVRDGDGSIYRAHLRNTGTGFEYAADTISRHDYSAVCEASTATTITTCPLPIAKAFDRMNGDISDQVQTTVFKVDQDGHSCGKTDIFDCGCDADSPLNHCKVSQVEFDQRSTYLFKYDVTDAAGNHAEQVVFALILNDYTRPAIDVNSGGEQWEAASCTTLTKTAQALDPKGVDSGLQLKYDIVKISEVDAEETPLCLNEDYNSYQQYSGDNVIPACGGNTYTPSTGVSNSGNTNSQGSTNVSPYTVAGNNPVPCALTALDTSKVGRYIVRFHVCDHAGVYGKNEQSNCFEVQKAIKISDTVAPTIRLRGFSPTYFECHWADAESNNCKDSSGDFIFPQPADCHRYIDAGADVLDALDTLNGVDLEGACSGASPTQCLSVTGAVDSSVTTEDMSDAPYTLTYKAYDSAGNTNSQEAVETRQVYVVDTTSPTAELQGPASMKVVTGTDFTTVSDAGAHCWDTCKRGSVDGYKWDAAFATAGDHEGETIYGDGWVNRTINTAVPGTYVRKYMCDDTSSLSHNSYVRRTFYVEDEAKPWVVVTGDETENVDAHLTEDYVDEGASCTDGEYHEDSTNDINLNKMVIVGGDIVDRRVPGTYVVSYECVDRTGNVADIKFRTVVVSDNEAPVLNMLGEDSDSGEAGATYTDPGCTANDNIDGDITNWVVTSGDQVNTIRAFSGKRSCYEIKISYPAADSGDYWIATRGQDGTWGQTKVYCDFSHADLNAATNPDFEADMHASTWTHTHTYKIVTGDQKCKVYSDQNCGCAQHGLDMAAYTADLVQLRTMPKFALAIPATFNAADNMEAYTYVCGLTHEGRDRVQNPHPISAAAIAHAMPGTYTIVYNVMDSSNNAATPLQRQVTISDNFKPVITLHLKGTRIHTSGFEATNKAGDAAYNPHLAPGYSVGLNYTETARDRIVGHGADVKTHHAYAEYHTGAYSNAANSLSGDWSGPSTAAAASTLMAEQGVQHGAWLVGAVGAAVSGLALLALSQKRQEAVVSVPV